MKSKNSPGNPSLPRVAGRNRHIHTLLSPSSVRVANQNNQTIAYIPSPSSVSKVANQKNQHNQTTYIPPPSSVRVANQNNQNKSKRNNQTISTPSVNTTHQNNQNNQTITHTLSSVMVADHVKNMFIRQNTQTKTLPLTTEINHESNRNQNIHTNNPTSSQKHRILTHKKIKQITIFKERKLFDVENSETKQRQKNKPKGSKINRSHLCRMSSSKQNNEPDGEKTQKEKKKEPKNKEKDGVG